ncbi:hypothetical protein R0137_15220 [Congregibacter brevis]|uniref:Uncharacterized protein n=1 Tax=Congregibacter brevis TaxID=3081201 RepID=A0ABZ0IAL4_9GAMM|nr:hypothetical protein R0137_15220 [Congregibacter sp. IMCC45268]
MLSVIASSLVGLGVALLYATWRSALPRFGRILGWSTIALGTSVWSLATGIERGIAIALIVLCISALGFVAVSASIAFAAPRDGKQTFPRKDKRAFRVRNNHQAAVASNNGASWMLRQRVGWLITAGPGAALLAFTTALASHQLLLRAGVLPENALVTELFMFPVLWGFLAVWSLMAQSLSRHIATMAILQIAIGLLCYAFAS